MSAGDVLGRIADDVVSTQPPLEPAAAAVALGIALAALLPWPAWRRTRHLLTILHEGGHAAAALATGRRLAGIRLHRDTSGLTVSRGRPRGPGMVLTAAAGYPAPALVGLGVALLVGARRPLLALWLGLLLLALVLLLVRNLFGLWVVLVTAGALLAITWWGSPLVHGTAAWALTAFLLLGAPRAVVELQRGRRGGRSRGSDADVLAGLTPLPALGWVLLLGAVTLACAVGGAWVLAQGLSLRAAG